MMAQQSLLVDGDDWFAVPTGAVRKYFRNDEWEYVQAAFHFMNSAGGMQYLALAERDCPFQRAWCRALNVAKALAEAPEL